MKLRDSSLTRAIRALTQVIFDVAAILDALVLHIEVHNPVLRETTARLSTDGVTISFSELGVMRLPAMTAVALAIDEIRDVTSPRLRDLDARLRTRYLSSPYDLAPRGGRPEQVIFLRAIKELDSGGFDENEIADLVYAAISIATSLGIGERGT
jgi:hypothetical protein